MRFEDFLRSIGLRPRVIAPNGRWYRCPTDSHPKKKDGAYVLDIGGRTGCGYDPAIHGTTPIQWREEDDAPPLTAKQKATLREQERRHEERRKREKREAVGKAREFYRNCHPLRDSHPYLDDHDLSIAGCEGLKVDDDGWLVVPAFRRTSQGNYEVSTVQRISPEGKKLFWKDAPADGASYAIPRQYASVTVLAEGLATGLALYAAIHPAPSARVLVAFTAGNLYHRDVVKRVPDGSCVVAADNDHETERRTGENPGVVCAGRAAVLLGCGVAVPKKIRGTDWADFRQERFAHHKERLHRFDHDFVARQRADAEIRRSVIPEASMNRLPKMVAS